MASKNIEHPYAYPGARIVHFNLRMGKTIDGHDMTFRFTRYFDFGSWSDHGLPGDYRDVRLLDDPPLLLLAYLPKNQSALVMEPGGYVAWMRGWLMDFNYGD